MWKSDSSALVNLTVDGSYWSSILTAGMRSGSSVVGAQPQESVEPMSSKGNLTESLDDDMRPEYDFAGRTGVRGKYYQKLRAGYTIKIQQADGTTLVQQITRPEGTITLDPDVREYFPDAEAVNTALRTLIQLVPPKKSKRAPASTASKSKSS
jgi:hypothetical protein